MAEEEKTTYPTIPVRNWWTIRDKFKQSIPTSVTPGYLAAALGMKEKSAKANILPSLIACKIVDQDGKPTSRTKEWRDDGQYSRICEEIRQEVYPQELLDALPPPSPNRESVESWFANKTGGGQIANRKMALVYILLCEANPLSAQEVAKVPTPKATIKKSKPTPSKTSKAVVSVQPNTPQQLAASASQPAPSIHIDIQIHISSDASAAQIDLIFASMAKHLYKSTSRDNE